MKSKYSKLFLIGNGFDRWQGLPTSYDQFRQYYRDNVHRIAKKLRIKTTTDSTGCLITPVELIFGDIGHPSTLPEEFFWNLESSMALLDDQKIVDYFPKTNRGVYQLQNTVDEALQILQKAFSEWIKSIAVEAKESGYRFGDECYFINFNYTDTLEKRFGVDEGSDYHIHGEADDPESIIVGHATHPEMAFPELIEQKMIRTLDGKKSKRLQGLFLIEQALYETDKHIQDNIDHLCEFMTLDGVNIQDITDIYVLGHSFAEPDFEYFEFLVKATQAGCDLNHLSALWKVKQAGFDQLNEESIFESIQLNIAYATQHRKRMLGKENMSFPQAEKFEQAMFGQIGVYTDGNGVVHKNEERVERAKEVVHMRFLFEQALRTKETIEDLCILKGVEELPSECCSVLKAAEYIDGGHSVRLSDAMWHVSYYSEVDKKRIEDVFRRTGCNRYELHQGIDQCIKEFKT